MNTLVRSFLDLIYPPLCVACSEFLQTQDTLLCKSCLDQLEVLDPHAHCPLCFSSDFEPPHALCNECKKTPSALNQSLAVFDYIPPAAFMIKKLKYANQQHLARGMASYMAMQLLENGWEIPDYIIPVPITWLRQIDRGYNQSLLLAEEIGKILGCPVINALGRRCGDLSQAGLSRGQRLMLGPDTFFFKEGAVSLLEKNILIVDDVMTTGTTLRRCAEVIAAKYPLTIRGLVFCRAF